MHRILFYAVLGGSAALAAGDKVILREDFQKLDSAGVPAGWERWIPRPQMALRFAPARDVLTPARATAFQMSGAGNEHAKGSLRRKLSNLDPAKVYRFRVSYSGRGIANTGNTIYPFVKWGEKPQLRILEPTGVKDGWTLAETILRPPAAAKGSMTLELFAGWIPAGSVYWAEAEVTELSDYHVPSNPVKVSVIDSRPPRKGTLMDNARFYADEIGKAAKSTPDVILFPEIFNTANVTGEAGIAMDSEYMTSLRDSARKHKVNLIGSVREIQDGILFNTAILIDRQGRLAGKYHQAQLDAPQSLLGDFSRGNEIKVLQTDFGKVGVLICWDYHFPEAVRTLVLQGAEMLFVPLAGDARLMEQELSMAAEYTGKVIALENRVPVVFSVSKGSSKNPSLIIDTGARVVARSSEEAHIIGATVDTKAHQWTGLDFRSAYFTDRRPELYGILAGESK